MTNGKYSHLDWANKTVCELSEEIGIERRTLAEYQKKYNIPQHPREAEERQKRRLKKLDEKIHARKSWSLMTQDDFEQARRKLMCANPKLADMFVEERRRRLAK